MQIIDVRPTTTTTVLRDMHLHTSSPGAAQHGRSSPSGSTGRSELGMASSGLRKKRASFPSHRTTKEPKGYKLCRGPKNNSIHPPYQAVSHVVHRLVGCDGVFLLARREWIPRAVLRSHAICRTIPCASVLQLSEARKQSSAIGLCEAIASHGKVRQFTQREQRPNEAVNLVFAMLLRESKLHGKPVALIAHTHRYNELVPANKMY